MVKVLQQRYYFLLVAFLIILDQLSKYLVFTTFSLGESVPIIEGLFHLTYAQNRGIAFSFLADFEYSRYLLPSISIIASVVLIILIRKNTHTLTLLAYSLILAGALGNFIDRAFLGFVIDFIHFYYKDYHFAIFNLADSFISIGVVLFLFTKNK